jgi:hypothetical protein
MNAVVILGAGATIGSGYRLCGNEPPGDRDFFVNRSVQERLSTYPALNAMLSFFRTCIAITLNVLAWRRCGRFSISRLGLYTGR